MRKAFVLLSGGIDSTTCLHQAIVDFVDPVFPEKIMPKEYSIADALCDGQFDDQVDWVEAVSVFYGQRHRKEMDYAKRTCNHFGIKHTILDVGSILSGRTVMLTEDSKGVVEVPNMSYNDIKGVSPTYVPFRNGTLLSAITAHAQKWVNEHSKLSQEVSAGIYFGAHSEDAANWAYPDCTPEFIGAMANAIWVGSYMKIRLYTPIQWMMKQDVIKRGDRLGVDWENTWSCYKGETLHCGVCPTCRSRREGFIAAGVIDPTEYAA